MSKIFSLIFVFLLAFPMTACGQSEVGETGAAGDTETIPAADTTESAGETDCTQSYRQRTNGRGRNHCKSRV